MTSRSKPLMRLVPIQSGAGISVISPASFAIPERVDRGVDRLRKLGYVPRLGAHTQARGPLFFAGIPESGLLICMRRLPTLKQVSWQRYAVAMVQITFWKPWILRLL